MPATGAADLTARAIDASLYLGPSAVSRGSDGNVVEKSLDERVVVRADVFRPNLLVLSDRAPADGVTKNRSAVDALQLEPVLEPQPSGLTTRNA
jgi:hypothetical protein